MERIFTALRALLKFLALSVCMKVYILEIIRATAIKFGDNILYYCMFALKYGHNPFLSLKLRKTNC